MHPGWIVLIILVSGPFAFLILHLVFVLANGDTYEFPLKINVNRWGPSHCPHCGKSLEERRPRKAA